MSFYATEPAADHLMPTAIHLEAIYCFVDLIYEAVEHPGSLEEALATLAELAEVGSVLLLAVHGDERRLVAAGRSPMRSSNSGYHPANVRSDATRTIPLCGGFELVIDRAELSPPILAALIRLAPHLARAVRLSERLRMAERGNPDRVEAIERLPIAALFLDGEGAVAFLTRQAREVLAVPAATRSFVGGRIPLPDGHWPRIDVMVAPYRIQIEKSEVRGVIFLSVPGEVKSPEEVLMDRYALTFEETSALGNLICGREPAKDDDRKRLQAAIHALYRKLGTTRQADLIRLLLRPPGVVFEPESGRSRTG
jgi:hypothetical protein